VDCRPPARGGAGQARKRLSKPGALARAACRVCAVCAGRPPGVQSTAMPETRSHVNHNRLLRCPSNCLLC